jgi:hypothetical protein
MFKLNNVKGLSPTPGLELRPKEPPKITPFWPSAATGDTYRSKAPGTAPKGVGPCWMLHVRRQAFARSQGIRFSNIFQWRN